MVYDPQQQRPEQQVTNNNRQTLNIQQPGETSDFDRQFFSSENWNKPVVEPEATMGDYVKAAGAGALDMVAGVGQLFKSGNQLLDEKNADTAGGANPLGIDSQMMGVMRQNAGNPVSRAGNFIIEGAGDLASAASQRIKDSYSDGAKKAASLDFVKFEHDQAGGIADVSAGEGLFDKDAWLINAVPTIAQLLTAGGVSKLGAGAAREMAERATFNRLSKSMPEEAARQLAKETADQAAAVAGKTTFVGAMSGSAQGQGGIDMREQINSLSFNELMESSTFQSAFSSIDSNPDNARLSDTQKLELARTQVADQAASTVTADPRLLAVNIAASTLGDHTLLKLLTRKGAASGVLSGMTTGAVSEGATEFAQGAGQRYVQNEQLIDTAGQKIDPMKDVLKTGANNAVVGTGMGGTIGAVGGVRGRQADQQSNPEPTAGDLTGDQPQATQVDVPEWQASGQPSAEGNGSSIPVVKMGEDSPPPGYTGEWRDGGPVISVTQGADNSQFNPENVVGTPQSRIDEFRDTPAYLREDPRIQGFAEDSDVQQALSEQQSAPTVDELIRQQIEQGGQDYSPQELEALEQAERIIAARRPRLPATGQKSLIAMSGEVRQPFSDEIQTGTGPQFTEGETRTQRQTLQFSDAMSANDQATLSDQRHRVARVPVDAQTEAKRAPTDEFLDALSFTPMQRGKMDKALQEMVHYSEFDRPVTRAEAVQRLVRRGWHPETAQGMSDNGRAKTSYRIVSDDGNLYNVTKAEHDFARHLIAKRDFIPVQPDHSSRATEGPLGELKLMSGRPFPYEKAAKASRWGKMSGATVEQVEGGYAVRLPAPKQSKPYDSRAAPPEGHTPVPKNASKSGGVFVSGADIGGGNIIHDGSFSRDGSKPEAGMLRDRVQLAADGFVSHLNGAAKIKVKAVQTQAEAAAMMPNGIPAEFGTVHAIYQPELSRVIVIADNIANARKLRAKLRHEVIAHHGLASVIGDVEYNRIMRVLHQTRDSQNKTIQDVWRQVEQSYGQESLETQANEFLAHMAERTELMKLGGVWDRFVTLLTNALRKAGVLNPMDITPAEIRNILRTITGRFQKTAMYANEQPGTREFDNTFSRTDALYSKADDVDPLKPLPQEAEQYRADLDRTMRSLKSGDVSVKLGRTPPVLRALGAPNLDMFINRDTVRKATNGVKHDVPLSVIENLPELMHDPLAVYRSATQDNAVVMLLEANDVNGNPVVSAVHMSAAQRRIEINRIASVYGTIGGMAKVQGMEDAGLALYRRKKENPDNPHSQGLQLPKEERSYQGSKPESSTAQELQLLKRGSPDQGSSKNILSSADIRKNKTLYSRSANPALDAETSRKMGFNVEKGWFDKAGDFYQMAADKDRRELKLWW
ncbi:hypothetical protein H5A35_06935 [Pectobacterium brasiliense]|uniref:MuF-C-terminal domain-containing protein n=1 Tax=Pectobacterium brasiliense TaxID=180957 RepID=UPI0019696C3B|nr:hypothetical protein [Pectobacterium brasiliense]MBN3207147.1 hypothetical protein [Pectobacterium brasiliense]